MILKSVEYVEFEGEPQQWRLLDFALGSVNLLVGKNATGKSRTLNLINGLGNLVSSSNEKLGLKTGKWKVEFSDEGAPLVYEVDIRNDEVQMESFTSKGKKYLDRSEGGIGKIYAADERKDIGFQTPVTKLAVVARQDSVQHPFLKPLYDWGKSLRHYPFGTPLGRDNYLIIREGKDEDLNAKDVRQVVAIFTKGRRDHDPRFTDAVKSDMEEIGYPVETIGVAAPRAVTFAHPFVGGAVGLVVKEKALRGETEQGVMSQGMFRALSIIIQLNYSYLAGSPSCILIDDIGEGLDFERSSALIKLLVRKAEKAGVQLIMATNDRFVMNDVPLEMWSVLQREGGDCRVYNYTNSKEIFDEFKFTGLNNFDFLAADFLNAGSPLDA